MSDTTANPTITINGPEEFRKVAAKYGIAVGERGRLPMRALARALVSASLKGDVVFQDTTYFQITAWAMGETVGTRKAKVDVTYEISYHVLNKNGKPMPSITLALSENEIRSYVPNVKGMISPAFATMAVALHKAKEGAPLSDLNRYVITSVARKESVVVPESSAETTVVAPKGDDTGETTEDAQTATEDAETIVADTHELVGASA